MNKVFQSLNEKGALEGLEVDTNAILYELGYGEIDPETYDFEAYSMTTNLNPAVYMEAASRCTAYMSYINEAMAVARHRKTKAGSQREAVYNRALAQNRNLKVTEAKSVAKATDEYLAIEETYNTVDAWLDYLSRFYDELKLIHYLMKQRADLAIEEHRKVATQHAHS